MLGKIDGLWLKVEKAGVVVGFLFMSAVVFADVVHRVFADTGWQKPGTVALVWGLLFLISVGAVRTSSRVVPRKQLGAGPAGPPVGSEGQSAAAPVAAEGVVASEPEVVLPEKPPLAWGKSILFAAVGVALAAATAYGFVWALPSGVIWAQKLALVLMLWVAFMGASIATRDSRHLKIDAAEKLFRGEAKKWVSAVGNVVAALFCGALAVLAWRYCVDKYQLYVETDGAGGDFEGLPIPMFLAYGILPVSLGVMAARFLGHAVKSVREGPPPQTLHGMTLPAGPGGPDGSGANAERAS